VPSRVSVCVVVEIADEARLTTMPEAPPRAFRKRAAISCGGEEKGRFSAKLQDAGREPSPKDRRAQYRAPLRTVLQRAQ